MPQNKALKLTAPGQNGAPQLSGVLDGLERRKAVE